MNLRRVVSAAFRRAPASVKGPVTITTADGSASTTGTAIGAAAGAAMGDSWRDQQTTRTKGRTLSVWPEGLTFAPTAGMKVTWGGETFVVVGVVPVAPDGGTPALYRLSLTR